jgi:phage tail sheath protein FI
MTNSYDPDPVDSAESDVAHPIAGVPTSITAFICRALRGPANMPIAVTSFSDFKRIFGGLWRDSTLGYAVKDFFCNGGIHAVIVRLLSDETGELRLWTRDDFLPPRAEQKRKGLYDLDKLDLFNILCIPPYQSSLTGLDVEPELVAIAASYCEKLRAMLIFDAPSSWKSARAAKEGLMALDCASANAALYFPPIVEPDPLREHQLIELPASGTVAGIFVRTDTQRGVWKAPAGLEATLVGVPELSVPLTDDENGKLNPLGINCLRSMPAAGCVAWGSRTLQGDDRLASEWKYIAVRRMALFIEESLYRGTKWVAYEPNDEPLRAQIRLNIGAFMHDLFRQGTFQGRTPQEAYFVKCDKEATTQSEMNLGIVNIVVGFAPLKPAEFVVIKLQQRAGQIQT